MLSSCRRAQHLIKVFYRSPGVQNVHTQMHILEINVKQQLHNSSYVQYCKIKVCHFVPPQAPPGGECRILATFPSSACSSCTSSPPYSVISPSMVTSFCRLFKTYNRYKKLTQLYRNKKFLRC